MAAMAVGSRQILFADTIAPASSFDSSQQISAVSDNQDASVTEAGSRPSTPVNSEAPPPATDTPNPDATVGVNLDMRA